MTEQEIQNKIATLKSGLEKDQIKTNPVLLDSLKRKIANLESELASMHKPTKEVEKVAPKEEKPTTKPKKVEDKPKKVESKPKVEKEPKKVAPKVAPKKEMPKAINKEKSIKHKKGKGTNGLKIGDEISWTHRITKKKMSGEVFALTPHLGDEYNYVVSIKGADGKKYYTSVWAVNKK